MLLTCEKVSYARCIDSFACEVSMNGRSRRVVRRHVDQVERRVEQRGVEREDQVGDDVRLLCALHELG